jgi:hypothetical protein
MCAVLVLAGCSKSERPVKPTPAPKAVKTQTASNAVPEKGAGAASAKKEFITAPTKPDAREVYAKTYPFPDGKTNAPVVSPEESMRAAKERGRAFHQKVFQEAIDHVVTEMQKCSDDLVAMEKRIRDEQATVNSSYIAKQQAWGAYERLLMELPGMAGKRARMEEILKEFNSGKAESGGEAGEKMPKMRVELVEIHREIVEIENAAQKDGGALRQAFDARVFASRSYDEALFNVPEYKTVLDKMTELQKQHVGLNARKTDLEKQEKKRL